MGAGDFARCFRIRTARLRTRRCRAGSPPGYDLLHRLGKHYEKPEFGLRSIEIDGVDVPVVEEIALEKPFCRLLHFKRELGSKSADKSGKRPADPTVLIVAPLSGHHATLLRDTVRTLLPSHDVYITDWINARMVPIAAGPFHLDDYVEYVIEFIQHLGPNVHVISVCQPTVPVLAAVSLMASNKDPKLPKTMTMMGGPIDPRRNPTQVNALAMRKTSTGSKITSSSKCRRRIRATCAAYTPDSCSMPDSSR